MVKPNIFIIGAPKCGTTALSEYLRKHPNIFMCNPKEPWYFSFDFARTEEMDEKKYLSLFSEADPSMHKIVGEASTSYLFSKCAVEEILKFNPDSKFIVMLRNPIDLVQSLHSQRCIDGNENVYDFEKAWKLEETRRNGKLLPPICWDFKNLMYSEWGMLGAQIERLFSKVERNKVEVIIFDDFVKNPKIAYERILNFLNIPGNDFSEFKIVNENKQIKYPALYQWLLRVGFGLSKFKNRFKFIPNLGLMRILFSKIVKKQPRIKISESFRRELIDCYYSDVIKLSKLLDRDLTKWVQNEK